MKKILILTMAGILSTTLSYAGALDSVKSAVKSDVSAVKSAVKADVNNVKAAAQKDAQAKVQAQTSTAQAKKQEKIKQMDAKIKDLNSQMTKVKEDKTITETQRTLQTQALQKQIDFYTKQKNALK